MAKKLTETVGNIADTINAFVSNVKSLNAYIDTSNKTRSAKREAVKVSAFAVFNAGGTWKDCKVALKEADVSFQQQTLEKYYGEWKDEKAIAAGETPKKQNKGGRKNPAAKPALKAFQGELKCGHPTTREEAVTAGMAYVMPYLEAAIDEAHTPDNPCFVGENATDIEKQVALANTHHACAKAMRSASGGSSKEGKGATGLAVTMRNDLLTLASNQAKRNTPTKPTAKA